MYTLTDEEAKRRDRTLLMLRVEAWMWWAVRLAGIAAATALCVIAWKM
jgi:hypothetical protein